MDTSLIEAFIALVDCKNFTKAAESLCISQSALSYRLDHLEKELDAQLILRSRGRRGFGLTQTGTEFIPLAERWLALAQDTVHFKNDTRQQMLSVSCVETISFRFAKLYKSIIDEQPFLLSLHTYNSPQTITDVEDQIIDIGFTVRERASRNVEVVPLFSEHHYLLGCLASDRRTIDPRTLDPHDELLTDWGSTFRAWHDSYFGLDHRPLAEVDTASSVFNYLADGVWCIVPASAVPFLQTISATYGHPVQFYEMTAPPPDRICYKVINRTPRPNRIDSIRYFEERLDIFLRENDLHL